MGKNYGQGKNAEHQKGIHGRKHLINFQSQNLWQDFFLVYEYAYVQV